MKIDPINPFKYKITHKNGCLVIELKHDKKVIRTISIKQVELNKIRKLIGTSYNTLSLMRRLVDMEVSKVFSQENKDLLLEVWDDITIELARVLLSDFCK